MKREEIRALVERHARVSTFSVAEEDDRFQIRASRSDIEIILTIPVEVTELYFEARSKDNTAEVKDWHDFYGESEHQDFKDELSEFLKALARSEFRFTNRGKTLEYFNGQWSYAFGDDIEAS